MHRVGQAVLALGAEHPLEILVDAEVALNLGLLMRIDDDHAVDTLGLERLLDHVLDHRLIQYRQQLLGRALGCREKACTQTGRRNDCLHVMNLRFDMPSYVHLSKHTRTPNQADSPNRQRPLALARGAATGQDSLSTMENLKASISTGWVSVA